MLDIWVWITGPWATFHRQLPLRSLSRLLGPQDRLYIVDRPLDPSTVILHPERLRHHSLKSQSLTVLKPLTLVHDQWAYRHPLLEKVHYLALKSQWQKYIRAEAKQVHWLMHPCFWPALRFFKSDVVVYDCYDEYTETPGRKVPRLIKQYEDILLRRADFSLMASQVVAERKADRARHLLHIPNPTDTALFFQARSNRELPEDLKRIPGPRVVYMGSLKPYLDQDLLCYLATQRPDVSFVMLGAPYASPDLSRLEALSNVYFLGHKTYAELPAYLSGCQVGLIPYQLDAYTRMLQPNKALEYLAAGLEVVSVNIPGLQGVFPEVLHCVDDRHAFLAALDTAIKRYPYALAESRFDTYNWDYYLEPMLAQWRD